MKKLFGVLCLLLLSSCNSAPEEGIFKNGVFPLVSDCQVPTRPDQPNWFTNNDKTYAIINGKALKLDLLIPKVDAPPPLIVLIHGGGWMKGDKKDYTADAETFASMGYAVANVNYRLAGAFSNRAPAAVEDARCAVRWLRSQAPFYGYDAARLGAVGFSAGAHLAAMLAMATDVEGIDHPECGLKDFDTRVVSAVGYYGPYDLRSSKEVPAAGLFILMQFLGGLPEVLPDLAKRMSPEAHVGADSAPFMMVHGDADGLVPVKSSRKMVEALVKNNRPHAYVEVAGADHGFSLFATEESFRAGTCTTLSFLHETLQLR